MVPRKSQQDQWLAEAVSALAEAERLTGLLAQVQHRTDLSLASLQAEIMSLRYEVERLRREQSGERRRDFDPSWLDSAWTVVR